MQGIISSARFPLVSECYMLTSPGTTRMLPGPRPGAENPGGAGVAGASPSSGDSMGDDHPAAARKGLDVSPWHLVAEVCLSAESQVVTIRTLVKSGRFSGNCFPGIGVEKVARCVGLSVRRVHQPFDIRSVGIGSIVRNGPDLCFLSANWPDVLACGRSSRTFTLQSSDSGC